MRIYTYTVMTLQYICCDMSKVFQIIIICRWMGYLFTADPSKNKIGTTHGLEINPIEHGDDLQNLELSKRSRYCFIMCIMVYEQ